MHQYRKKTNQPPVIAVQIDIDLDGGGIAYRKWGDDQWAKKGDWIVENNGDVYTIEAMSFASTYSRVGHGQYIKTAKVWAEQAEYADWIKTKEGVTEYDAGDWLVYNGEDRQDGYAMSNEEFMSMYEMAP